MSSGSPDNATTPNAIGRGLDAIGDEWSLLIVRAALLGSHRFGDFRNRLGISDSVLSGRLSDLTEAGLMTLDDAGSYRLTPAGADLWRILVAIWSWERTWVAGQADALPPMRHVACQQSTSLVVTCAACEGRAEHSDLEITPTRPDAFARSLPSGARRRRSARRTEDPLGLGHYDETMTLIGSRWSTAHLGAVLMGLRRFGEIQSLTGAPPNVVSERLGTFVDVGVLIKTVDGYDLTDKGSGLLIVVAPFFAWAARWFGDSEGPPLVVTHRSCGNAFVPNLACAACGVTVNANSLSSRPAA